MPKKKKSSPSHKTHALSIRMQSDLFEADQLIETGRPDAAYEILTDLDRKRPNHPEILRVLVNACYELGDLAGYEWAIYRLHQKIRNEADIALSLAGAHLIHGRIGLAIRAFESYLKRWPAEPPSADVREKLKKTRALLLPELKKWQGSDEERIDIAARHDEVRFFLEHNQFREAARRAELLLKDVPDFYPVMNNLAQVHILEGKPAAAAEVCERVLAGEPDNVHALANLVRARFMSGEFDAAHAAARRLKESAAPATDRDTKKAEAFSLLGEVDEVLGLYALAKKQGPDESSPGGALRLHYTAVALANTGQEDEARQLWRQALDELPAFDLAVDNLEDLDRPVAERSGAWAFPGSAWVRPEWILRLNALLSKPAIRRSDAGVEAAARRLLGDFPEISPLIPHMLARGDPMAVEFAVNLSRMAETPELIEALQVFVREQRGPDKLRLETANFLSSNGHLPSGEVRMWVAGEWQDLLMLNFEISPEPVEEFTDPELQDLAGEAIYALHDRNPDLALVALEKALQLAPDSPSLLNNMAMAYEMKGSQEQAHEMMRQIHERFPDYFFGIIGAVQLAIKDGDLAAARDKLAGLMRRTSLHTTEFTALCTAQIELFLAEKNKVGAQRWLEMWEKVDPDHPGLVPYRLRLAGGSGLDLLKDLKKLFKGK